MPAPSRRTTVTPVLGRAQGLGVVRPPRLEPVRLPGALEMPIADIAPDPTQPRQNWRHDEGEQRLADLTASIAEFGILQPLLVRPAHIAEDGPPYWLVAGNRRLEAARRAGLGTVPVVVRETNAVDVRILQLTENLLRQDLAPLDEARAYQELIDLEQLSPRGLATRLHISDQQVRSRLRLLGDQVLADAVERRQIAASTARLIQQLPDEEQLPFRERARLGERLQANDMAAVRARLLADGAAHPRRTRPPTPRITATLPEAGDPGAGVAAQRDTSSASDPRTAGEAAETTPQIESPAGIESDSASPAGRDTGVPLFAGGQTVFDPPQKGGGVALFDPRGSVAVTQLPSDIASLLANAEPDPLSVLSLVVRTGRAHSIEPAILRDALLLLADLVRMLARHEPSAAALLERLESADHE